ncbi:hypothetical protein [Mesorhizobium sp. B2-3-15]|nr:hypothetical protein [Mesorhizobium sp. B2-3-15]
MQPTIEPIRGHDIEVVARLRIAAFFEGTEGRWKRMRQGSATC